jgi:hypothetical protein
MRYFPALCAAVLAAVLSGCGSGVTLPPVAPEDVEVYMPGLYPMYEYEVLGPVQVNMSLETPDEEMVERAKARAAELGADALVISAIRQTTEGQVDLDLSRSQEKILEALAVYYPSQHPELSNK